jgi:hypothetical protein
VCPAITSIPVLMGELCYGDLWRGRWEEALLHEGRERNGGAALCGPYLGHLGVMTENGFDVWMIGWRDIEQLQYPFVTYLVV